MAIIVTGCAGFIGFSIAKHLLNKNEEVIGIDNLNNYYSVKLKKKRLEELKKENNFQFIKKDCSDVNFVEFFSKIKKISLIIHMAAEVGVRNSYSKPNIYYKNNIKSFFNILETCRRLKSNLIFASSSSVYGSSKKSFFEEIDDTSKPISFYAASKKCNEVMAYAYSKNYKFSAIGIRFFNVYGPWGRPDMSIYKFTNLIIKNKKIPIYGTGNQIRDFTYIEDAVGLISKIIKKYKNQKKQVFEIFNSGKGECIRVNNLLKIISKKMNLKPKIEKKRKQRGDVHFTNSSSKKIKKILKYHPKVSLNQGIDLFLDWFIKIGIKIK